MEKPSPDILMEAFSLQLDEVSQTGSREELEAVMKYTQRAMPDALTSEEAEELLEDLVDAGLLDENWQPKKLSGSEKALVAKAICERLCINEVWQVFGQLWNEKPVTLRSYFNKALDQKKSLDFQEKLKKTIC